MFIAGFSQFYARLDIESKVSARNRSYHRGWRRF